MRKFIVAILIGTAALTSVTSTAWAQRYLDEYRGRSINDAKNSLRYKGFSDTGHITRRRGTYALMYDGRTCIALHGGQGVIDDIDVFDPRDCEDQRRPPRQPGPRPRY